jgi:ferredoxin
VKSQGEKFFDEGLIVPKLTVEGFGDFEVAAGKRLVLALTEDAGVDQLHACGGVARCTTCRVEILAGEPAEMTVAEKDVLLAKGASGVRLSCQLQVQNDMTVRCISRLQGSGRAGPGQVPSVEIAPIPDWTTK